MQLYEVFKGDGGFGGHSASMHKAGLAMFGGHGVRYSSTGGLTEARFLRATLARALPRSMAS